MAISRSIQFKGKASVIKAYEMKRVASWSLWCNTQLLHLCEVKSCDVGIQELDAIIDMYMQSPTPAVYTLRVHSVASLKKTDGHLCDRTPFDGSFNFQLVDNEELASSPGNTSTYAMLKAIHDNQTMINARLEKLEAGEDESESEDAIGQIQRVMQIPGIGEAVGALIGGLFGKQSAPQGIAGIELEQKSVAPAPEQVFISQGIIDALAVLMSVDPDCEAHLVQLAAAAQKNPAQFLGKLKMAITFL